MLRNFGANCRRNLAKSRKKMFEFSRTAGRNRKSIIVETHLQSRLENFIAPPATFADDGMYKAFRSKHGTRWQPRKPATGVYNCAGMVWANRRTALPEPGDWETILCDDGYRRLDNPQEAAIGDVVVYRLLKTSQISHIARVCKIERMDYGDAHGAPMIFALSKWNTSYGEDIHRLEDVFIDGGEPFRVEVHTDRPAVQPFVGFDRPLLAGS